jgi:HEAT repeat protein
MTPISIDELFASTLNGDYDSDEAWDAVHALRRVGTREVFDHAASWCKSPDPLKRARGIDVLAQLGKTSDHRVNSFPDESYAIVSESVRRETEVLPLYSVIIALGHLDNQAAVELVAPFHRHLDAEIRFATAFSLGTYPNPDLSVLTLLLLMDDSNADVRDWATFGLGVQGDRDSLEIRDALFRRLSDSNEDVREEAMVGLAKRKDARVLHALRAAIEAPEIKIRVAEAASLMLGLESDPEGWGAEEYRSALSSKFPLS